MDKNETRDCQPYDNKTIAIDIWKKQDRLYRVKIRRIAAAVILCAIILSAVINREKISEFFASYLGGSSDGWEGGEFYSESEYEENRGTHCAESENIDEASDMETIDETDFESESLTEGEKGPQKTESDMSNAELGEGYLINYSGEAIDVEGILEMGFANAKYSYSERPTVLILHTHTSEGYFDLDKNHKLHTLTKSVVAVGERVAYKLNSSGIATVHCTVIHDGDGSPYANARKTIEYMLKIYPSIEYVIDLHRLDLTDDDGRYISCISPMGVAQIRITVSSDGRKNQDTLALALGLRKKLNFGDRRLCMPVVYTNSSYNASLSPYYLKIDVGSLGNDANEAIEAGELFAEAFADLLKK